MDRFHVIQWINNRINICHFLYITLSKVWTDSVVDLGLWHHIDSSIGTSLWEKHYFHYQTIFRAGDFNVSEKRTISTFGPSSVLKLMTVYSTETLVWTYESTFVTTQKKKIFIFTVVWISHLNIWTHPPLANIKTYWVVVFM